MWQRRRVAKGYCATWNLRIKENRWNWQSTAWSELARLFQRWTGQCEPEPCMTGPVYLARFTDKAMRAWTYEMPDGKLEQFQIAVGN